MAGPAVDLERENYIRYSTVVTFLSFDYALRLVLSRCLAVEDVIINHCGPSLIYCWSRKDFNNF